MSLQEYRRKRRFGATREPEPGKVLPGGQRAIFVVQLHHASRRHYDFRLQVGDALKSWAVPKGPSFDPTVKRLAAEVEDHPIDYAEFEGEIPQGHYGGGHVALFDRGVWSTEGDAEEQLAKGHLRFELLGEKLKGRWHLIRSRRQARQPEWLLVKQQDEYAGPIEADDLLDDVTPPPAPRGNGAAKQAATKKTAAKKTAATPAAAKKGTARRKRVDWAKRAAALPRSRARRLEHAGFEPQLAKLGAAPPQGDAWLHEIKWDGYRILATIVDGDVRLWSRNALDWTDRLPDIVAALRALRLDHAAFDGELIAGSGTQDDFSLLQATLSGEKHATLLYVLFDLLHIDGVDIERAPLLERKALLADVLADPPPHLQYSTHVVGDGDAAYALAVERRLEGIISKRVDGGYVHGRSDDWRKTKRLDADEFAIAGFTAPRGSREGFGSLLLARPDAVHGWRYAGKVGSGFSDAQLRELHEVLAADTSSKPTVHIDVTDVDLRTARWITPAMVAEVYYRGIASQGVLRQASLKAIRHDKTARDLGDGDRPPQRGKAKAKAKQDDAPRAELKLSNPGRVVYPERGYTKLQVAEYYRSVMDWLLPEIEGRPLSIVRCPDGLKGACFFQKHHTAGLQHVATVRLKEEAGNQANYLVVQDADAVMELVQFNALEFHPWGAHATAPDLADRIVFDLDPGPGVAWADVRQSARQLRDLLAQLDLQSFLRTSGGKGLHVVVPLNPMSDWDTVKGFARAFAETLARTEPQRYVATATKSLRNGRIFVDYLRNGRGATSVASYSLRARPNAAVALPLAWSELSKLQRSDAFDLLSVPKRLQRLRRDPWEGIDGVKQGLAGVGDSTPKRK